MNQTKIDWCDSTWNPVTGCLHGCAYCYARRIAERFGGKQKYANVFEESEPIRGGDGKILAYPHSFSPTFHRYRLNDYIGKKGRNIFVCSMADLFGDWVPDSWIEEVFKVCEKAPQHNYLFLTKNPKRYVELINNTDFFVKTNSNMWFGYSYTSNECKQWWNPDYNIFASVEPILEPVDIPCCKWLIIGAETGRRKGKVVPEKSWVDNIVEQCKALNIPVFMKESLRALYGDNLLKEFPQGLICG